MNADLIKALPQYLIPQHLLTRLAGKLARVESEGIKNWGIKRFIDHYGVDMSTAVEPDYTAYRHFNDFFTRAIRPETRPIVEDPATLACPVDGAVSQVGVISQGKIFQAKGHYYTAHSLLGDRQLAEPFQNGQFCTLYLAPKDYHRIHMPCDGKLTSMIHVPGKLFSVNPLTARTVPHLFARNERVVCMFDTEFGPMAMVLVGATIVGSVETVWAGQVTPPTRGTVHRVDYEDGVVLAKGVEMGRFLLGSTVIVCLPNQPMQWSDKVIADAPVKMGQPMVTLDLLNEPQKIAEQ